MKKTQESRGWGLRVGGSNPYLGYHFSIQKKDIQIKIKESYHRAVRVVILPLGEWKRLKKKDKEFI